MARTWLSIRVELVSGRGEQLWPRPGRIFAVARSHTFALLAEAIDAAFARWDTALTRMFMLSDGTEVSPLDGWIGDPPAGVLDWRTTKLGKLRLGEPFAYVFDLGDDWAHLCEVAPSRIDPGETLGVIPYRPIPYWGWGDIPDQYGRRWDGDDGESPIPAPPKRLLEELPPVLPGWGQQPRQP